MRREGRWDEPSPRASKRRSKRVSRAAQFVRVRVVAASVAPTMRLTLRVGLANGRSGELDLAGTEQLLQVLGALEQPA